MSHDPSEPIIAKSCSASGRELREQLWPTEKPKKTEIKERRGFSIGAAWRAMAYILVGLFTASSALAMGMNTKDQIGDLFGHVGKEIDRALDF